MVCGMVLCKKLAIDGNVQLSVLNTLKDHSNFPFTQPASLIFVIVVDE